MAELGEVLGPRAGACGYYLTTLRRVDAFRYMLAMHPTTEAAAVAELGDVLTVRAGDLLATFRQLQYVR